MAGVPWKVGRETFPYLKSMTRRHPSFSSERVQLLACTFREIGSASQSEMRGKLPVSHFFLVYGERG